MPTNAANGNSFNMTRRISHSPDILRMGCLHFRSAGGHLHCDSVDCGLGPGRRVCDNNSWMAL